MKTFLISCLLLLSVTGFSQNVFQKISFLEALKLANNYGKMILVQLESLDCEMCNYVYTVAFKDEALVKKINATFIVIKVNSKHSDRTFINNLYDLNDKSFGTLFIDGNKNLVHRIDKTTNLASVYNTEFDMALYKNSEVIKLDFFEEVYNKSKSNNDLEQWIFARKNLNLNSDSLLNMYAKNLLVDSAESPRVLTFIALQAPQLGSKADLTLRQSSQFNAVWYTIPLKERIYLNSKIISKSMQKAIAANDKKYGFKIASFAAAVHDDKVAAMKSFNFQLMKYYEGVTDLNNYMLFATQYFDSVLLKTTVADVLKIDSSKKVEMMNTAEIKKTEIIGKTKKVSTSFAYSPRGQLYTNALNQAAWFIYKNSDDKTYLTKALDWVAKGNQYAQKFEAMDTEARILYKLNEKRAAIVLMEKAVAVKNERIKSATAFNNLDMVLQNMKENKVQIDVE